MKKDDNVLDLIPDAGETEATTAPAAPRPVRISKPPRLKPGANIKGVRPELVDFASSRDFTITSGVDSPKVHVPGSLHGSGDALDLRVLDKRPEDVQRAIRDAGEAGFNAKLERKGEGRATQDHIHLSRRSGGGTPTTPAPQPPDANVFDQIPDDEDVLSQIPDATPIPTQESAPATTISRPGTSTIPQPGARASAPQAPNPPASTQPTSITPQPAGTRAEPAGADAGAPVEKHLPRFDQPGYADALTALIKQKGMRGTQDLAEYTKWLNQASEYGRLDDPEFMKGVLSGHIQGPRVARAPGHGAPQPGAPAGMAGPPNEPLPAAGAPAAPSPGFSMPEPVGNPVNTPPPAAKPGAPSPGFPMPEPAGNPVNTPPPVIGSDGVMRVEVAPGDDAPRILYKAYYGLAKSAKLPDALADQYANQVVQQTGSRGFTQGEEFVEGARKAGAAGVRADQPSIDLLNAYFEEYQRKGQTEAQMTADTGVLQSSTDEQQQREIEVRGEVEKEVAREMTAAPQSTPEGVPTPNPSFDLADEEARKREVDTRVQSRLAMERMHGELSALTIDPARVKDEMRAAVEAEFADADNSRGGASKSRQEYAGMMSMLPGARAREIDRLAEERTRSLIDDIEYAKRSTDPVEAVGVLDSIFQRFRKNPVVLFPVAAALGDYADTLKAREAQQRVAQARAQGQEPAQRDVLTLAAHDAAEHANKSFWAKVGDIVVEQPAFWGEFYLTGGMASAIEGAAGRTLARVGIRGLPEAEAAGRVGSSRLTRRVLGEVPEAAGLSLPARSAYAVGGIVSKTVQTALSGGARAATVGLPHIANGYVERRMKGEDGPTAFIHSVLDTAGEYISESQGDVLELMPGMARLNKALEPVMKRFESAGYHGIVGEIYEERWKDLWDVATGVQKWEAVKEKWEDPVNWGVEAVGFGLPGVGRAMAGHAARAIAGEPERPVSSASSQLGIGPLPGQFVHHSDQAEGVRGRIEELRHDLDDADLEPEARASIEAEISGLEEEAAHHEGLAGSISTHLQEVALIEEEVKRREAQAEREEAEAQAPAAQPAAATPPAEVPAESGDEQHIITQSGYEGAERRGTERGESSDYEYFKEALRDHNIKLIDGPAGSYEFRVPGAASVRVATHAEMTRKARELLVQQQTIGGEFSTPEGGGPEGKRAADAAKGGELNADEFADEIMRELAGETTQPEVDENGFRKFPDEAGAMGIQRSTMPQIKSEHRGALVQYLKGRGVEHEQMNIRPSSLKPTQAEYSPEKVGKARERAAEGPGRSILVSGDGYVLDGTHQWQQALEDAPEQPYPVIAFHANAKELLPLIADFPSSYANKESEGGPKEAPLTADAFADEIMSELGGDAAPAKGSELSGHVAALEDADVTVRRHAVVALRALGDPAAVPALEALLEADRARTERVPPRIVREAIAALGTVNAEPGTSSPKDVPGSVSAGDVLPQGGATGGNVAAGNGKGVTKGSKNTPATQPAGDKALSPERQEIANRRAEVKRKLHEAHDRRLREAGADPDKGEELRHGGPQLPSREEVVLTAELLLTYAQEGTLIFKEAVARFVEDMSADYARELGKAFETGWRILKKKGFDVDEPGSVDEALKEVEQDGGDDVADDAGGGTGDAADDEDGEAGEDSEEAEGEEDDPADLSADPLEPQPGDPTRVMLGRRFADIFLRGGVFPAITNARKLASEMLGVPVEPGTQQAKEVDEAVEIGVGIAARLLVRDLRAGGRTDAEIYTRLVDLYTNQQPNLGVRTSTSALEQAYSSPAPLAFIASRLAGINRTTSVLGNTAGNGMLFIEAAPEASTMNEKNASRFAALEALFPLADVRQGDALALQTDRKFDVYIENPPFGTVKDAAGESRRFEVLPGFTTTEIDHAIAFRGLAQMEDKGRAVLVVGSVKNETDHETRKDQYDAKNKRLFYYHLYNNYNVIDHFTVSGDLYERQGAGWPVDMIVIDGRGKSKRKYPAADAPRVYKSWGKLGEVLTDAKFAPEVDGVDAGDRPEGAGGSTRGGDQGPRGAGTAGHGDVPVVSGGQGAGDVRAGDAGGDRGGAVSTDGGESTGDAAADDEGARGGADTGEPGDAGAAGGDGRAGQAAEEDPRGQPAGAKDSRGDKSVDVGGLRVQQSGRAKVDITKAQVPYEPASTSRGMKTLTPVNMASAAQNALDALVKLLSGGRAGVRGPGKALAAAGPRLTMAIAGARVRTTVRGTRVYKAAAGKRRMREGRRREGVGTLDRYVADRLGYDVKEVGKYFGAEQVDAIALAIYNIERGAGMILGDQTGIGKGRVVAAVLRYARLQGHVPLFITEKPNLYKDMARDLSDIGEGTLEELAGKILMTNSALTVPINDDEENPVIIRTPDAKTHNSALRALAHAAELPEGKEYVFTTYNQMQKLGGATARQEFLAGISGRSIIVFDESHNAGGTEAGGWGAKKNDGAAQGHDPLSRAGFAREIIANAVGVLYSSATFAKRASVMDLYSKTDMSLAVSNTPLAEMIAKGGVPLQQIVSAMLVESKQMLRRERSFEGIEYATAIAAVDQDSAETVSSVMNAVFEFDKVKKATAGAIKDTIREAGETFGVDPATGAVSASSTSFSSLIHNLVDQMLLSLKMGPAIEQALESLRNNEKPVITVAFTMGSFLQNYAEEFGLQPGEAVALNFGDMLKRYLDRTREITYKRPDGTKYRQRLTDEQLGPEGVRLYNEAVEMIQGADWSKMPVSPIDYIKDKIESEVNPATGRAYRVGEITGRTYALGYKEHFRGHAHSAVGDGEIAPPTFRRRSQTDKSIRGRLRAIAGFQNGSIDAMILNQAGATGLSLHADGAVDAKGNPRAADRRRRHMIIAQPERNIDTHMQMLGRIHRTGQVILPRYTQLVADIPSEKRPAAVLAKKMASLNANTTAARGSKFRSEAVVDFMNQYGDEIAAEMMSNNPDLHFRLGEPLINSEGEIDKDDAARRVTGRLPILRLAEAEEVYAELESEYTALIERLDAMGENALEAQTLALDARTLKVTEIFKGQDESRPFGRGAVAEEVDVKRLRKPYGVAQVLDLVRRALTKRFEELKAVEDVPKVEEGEDGRRALSLLEQKGEFLQGYQREALQTEYDTFLAAELEKMVTAPKKDEAEEETASRAEQRRRVTETRHNDALRKWHEVHGRFHVGQTVMIASPAGEMYGVVTDIARAGRAANPATLGAWRLHVAVADAARSVPIPFSKIRPEGDRTQSATDDLFSDYIVTEADDATIFDFQELKRVTVPVLDAFEHGQSVSRERRVIVTGNLLAGFGRFEKAKGQIINFTDSEGQLRQGILMPKDFDVEKALDDEPVVFRTVDHVMKFLQGGPGLVETPDVNFRISMAGVNFRFVAAASKGKGQTYWGNAALLDALGGDFVKKGDFMGITVRPEVAREAIRVALANGWTLHTTSYKDRARKVTGEEKAKGQGGVDNLASPIKDRGGRSTSKAEGKGKRADEAESGDTPLAEGESRPANLSSSAESILILAAMSQHGLDGHKVAAAFFTGIPRYNDAFQELQSARLITRDVDSFSLTPAGVIRARALAVADREAGEQEDDPNDVDPHGNIEDYSLDALRDIAADWASGQLSDYEDVDEIVGFEVVGSRTKGKARSDSDLDVLVEYRGNAREDALFDFLNGGVPGLVDGGPLTIAGVKVDFNPIKEESTGTIEGWLREHGYVPRGSADLASSRAGGRSSLTAQRDLGEDVENFQVSQRVRQILRKLNLPNAEKSLSSRLLGIFKLREKKVRVQSLFDVFTAAHEAMHGISVTEEIGERVIADTGRGAPLRERLTEIYVEFYPRAKESHPLRKRVEEGLAVLVERYLLDPADIQARYGDLVAAFIRPGGRYHSARTTTLLDEMAALVGDYAKMSGAQRIGARVASGKEVVARDKGYSVVERMVKTFANKAEPLRRYAKREGVTYTPEDPMAPYFGFLNRSALVHGWVEGNKLAVLRPDGTYDVLDGSVKTYLRLLKKGSRALKAAGVGGAFENYEGAPEGLKEFDVFLVARRVVSDHNRRTDLIDEAHDPLTPPDRRAEALAEAAEIEAVLANDDFSLQDAATVVTDYGPAYAPAVAVYDRINKALVRFAENAGLITPEYAAELKTSQGYAAFVRKIYDDAQSDYSSHGSSNSQTKVRTFKTRKGSTLDIVSPTFTQITSIGEVIGKGLQNRLWNNVLRLGNGNEEIARRFEVIPTETNFKDGRVEYPQMRDPKLIHILVRGKHVFVKPAQEFADVAAHLRPQELDLFAKYIKAPSALFTRLTTSANPFWAIANLTIDQITATMNSQTGFIPVVDPARSFVHFAEYLYATAVEKKTGVRPSIRGADLFERYMELGGKKQTFASSYELAPEDAIAKVLGGRTTFQHSAHVFEVGLGVLEFPSNLSEYLTRYSEFRRAVDRGETDEVAMYLAAEVTVPFQQRGVWGGKMGESWVQTLPYFNALVQVNYKFLRNAKEQPARTATVAAALMVSALGSALALLRWLDDDDEAKRVFMNLPARELARAIYLPHPTKSGALVRIRVPEQVGAITGLMYLYAIQMYGGNKVRRDDVFTALASPLPEQADISGVATEGLWGLAKPVIAWLPQAVRPTVQVIANIKSYPEIGPIVPRRLQDLKAPELQFNDYTSAVGKQFGALMGVSPMKVDYWIRNQFGAVGGAIIGSPPGFPLVRQAREYEVAERTYDVFYGQKAQVDAQMERLKAASKGGGLRSFSEAERKEVIAAATLYEKMADVLSNVRKAQGVRVLTPALKREVHDTLVFFDGSADITRKAEAIERLNKAVMGYARESGAKIDHAKEVPVPEGMERVTKEGIIDLNINRRREIKLPPPGAKP